MLNYIWAFMILIGILYGALTGTIHTMGNTMIDSGKEAINLCITMLGVVSLWTGLMEVAKEAGIIDAMIGKLDPFIRFLFPHLPKGHKSREYIATNIIANILGLGWAATPAGLKAMEALAQLEEERGSPNRTVASNEMCTFLVLNISSLQLIPVNIIAYRSQYGSVNPSAIIGPGILATLFSTVIAIIFCKVKSRRR
ncbi:MAG: nucleoside recognition protein [Lachnospiraceae bacterium]